MNTDDRDIESSNPSKNFKVGDVDQLSGFFTPVWESKRRIRSEPPAPPSSKGNSGSGAASSPSQGGSSPPSALDAAEGRAPTKTGKGTPIPRPRAGSGSKTVGRTSTARASTPPPPPASERPASGELAGAPAPLPADVAAVFNAPTSEADLGSAAPAAAPAALHPSGAPQDFPQATSAAARALRDAGPNLPPAAFLDPEPEFRSAPPAAVPRPSRTDRPGAQLHAQRASQAASRVHEQLKAKLQAEAAEIEESRLDLDPDTNRDGYQAEPSAYDPFPISLLRRLRRTIRLSTPVPDPIRSLISKYDRG